MHDAGACRCGCTDPRGDGVHAIVAALAIDDLDAAIDAGLLACDGCGGCAPECTQALVAARDGRRAALAARERFRTREARRARLQQERLARRIPAVVESPTPASLPPAAADALQRALAKAASRPRR